AARARPQRWPARDQPCAPGGGRGGAHGCRSAVPRARQRPRRPPLCSLPRPPRAPAGGAELLADVRYGAKDRTLLVGEANFSFAAALCRALGDGAGLTATAPEPREELQARHGAAAARRAARLEERLCGLHFRCSAAELDQRFRPGSFDRVVFNFPLCAARPGGAPAEGDGRGGPRAADAHARGARQAYEDLSVLLEAFFPAAAAVLRTGGECHLRLTDQYLTARGLRAAPACGLALLERLDFFDAFERVYRPLGYRPAVVAPGGGARGRRAGFDVRHSSTWHPGLPPWRPERAPAGPVTSFAAPLAPRPQTP
ncbi:unnamed protein product, partial [Prorocentrum cordatum]